MDRPISYWVVEGWLNCRPRRSPTPRGLAERVADRRQVWRGEVLASHPKPRIVGKPQVDPSSNTPRPVGVSIPSGPLGEIRELSGFCRLGPETTRPADQDVEHREVNRYQAGETTSFDNRLLLRPDVGEYLLRLAGLLRPLVQRRWAAMVAQLNRLEESQLEMFLFGADRTLTAKVRPGLWEIQERRCFYCAARLREPAQGHVDHFVPWVESQPYETGQ